MDPSRDWDREHIDGYIALSTDETTVRIAVSRQPIVASIRVGDDFKKYSGGIYKAACGTVGHAVLIVGYGEIREGKYWYVKNSWGEDWGIAGYFLMAREDQNDDPKAGHCGILTRLVYPILLDV
jgi:C1A family cysteine protease